MKTFVTLLLVLVSALSVAAQATPPSAMPNVQITDRREYVSDPARLLSAGVKAEVNRRLYELRQRTSVEAVVAIPPSIGDIEPQQWCEELFTAWGIGKSDKDNGVLFMISPGSRCAFIMPGYGVEGVLTDITCRRIVAQTVIPAMKDDNLDAAVESAVNLMVSALEDPAVADELRSSQSDNFSGLSTGIDASVIWSFVRFVAGLMFLISLGLFIRDCVGARRHRSNYSKAEMWRSHLALYFWLGVLSFGAGLVFFLLAFFIYRRWRTRKIKCPVCGAGMKRLPEDKDNLLLTDSQDFEEKIRTVDYDVWECPRCGAVERFPYRARQKKYTECPSCHTVAMSLESDTVVRPSTVRTEGEGVKIYECRFCHHRDRRPYRIPRKEDPSAAIAAAAVIGSALGRGGRGGGGGGGFGGGFGGGATGGGGAGGSW